MSCRERFIQAQDLLDGEFLNFQQVLATLQVRRVMPKRDRFGTLACRYRHVREILSSFTGKENDVPAPGKR